MPFRTISLKEEAAQIIKDSHAEGHLRHGLYVGEKNAFGKRFGCAVGQLSMAKGWDGSVSAYAPVMEAFGLTVPELRRIENAYEGERRNDAGEVFTEAQLVENTIQVIKDIPVR